MRELRGRREGAETASSPEAQSKGIRPRTASLPRHRDSTGETEPSEAAEVLGDETRELRSPDQLLVDDWPVGSRQMVKANFLEALREGVTAAVEDELASSGWSAIGCPYIDEYFRRYGGRSAADAEAFLRKYVPEINGVAHARDAIALVVARIRSGVQQWRETGRLPEDVTAAEAISGAPPPASTDPISDPSAMGTVASFGPGQPLDTGVATRMADALEAPLPPVTVHTGPQADAAVTAANAQAMTLGGHVAFADGAYAPGTPEGDALLAHELAHTVQQGGATGLGSVDGERGDDEEEADQVTGSVLGRLWGGMKRGATSIGQRIRTGARTGLSLQRCSNKGPSKSATVEQFMSRRMAIKNHMPSTRHGAFDVAYTPKEGILHITLRLSFDAFDSKDGKKKWAPGEAKAWQTQYQDIIQTRWSSANTGHSMRCTRPGWESLVAAPVVRVEWVEPDADPHFKLRVTKGQLEAGVRPPKGALNTVDGQPGTKQIAGTALLGDSHVEPMGSGSPDEKLAETTLRQVGTGNPGPVRFADGQADVPPDQASRVAAFGDVLAMVHEPPLDVELRSRPANGEPSGIAEARARSVNQHLRSSREPGHNVRHTIGPDGDRIVEIHLSADSSFRHQFHGGAHESGHMMGLDEENSDGDEGVRSIHYGLVEEAFGTPIANAFASRAPGDHSTGIMSHALEVRPYHYVTFWEALGRVTEPDLSRSDWRIE